jgi:hypothetical protein
MQIGVPDSCDARSGCPLDVDSGPPTLKALSIVGLDAIEHKANKPAWTAGTIASPTIPSSWSGSLAASGRAAGPIASPDWPRNSDSLRDLTDRFSYDCLWRAEARSKKGKSACGEQTRPPDAPPGMVRLRLVKNT